MTQVEAYLDQIDIADLAWNDFPGFADVELTGLFRFPKKTDPEISIIAFPLSPFRQRQLVQLAMRHPGRGKPSMLQLLELVLRHQRATQRHTKSATA